MVRNWSRSCETRVVRATVTRSALLSVGGSFCLLRTAVGDAMHCSSLRLPAWQRLAACTDGGWDVGSTLPSMDWRINISHMCKYYMLDSLFYSDLLSQPC